MSDAGARTGAQALNGHKARLLLSSVSCAALLAATPLAAQSPNCQDPSSSHTSCTISSGTYTSTGIYSGQGDDGDGDSNGEDGPAYTLTNYGTVSVSGQYWGLAIGSDGGDGSDDNRTDAGDGGQLTFTNYGNVTVSGTASSTVYGLYARSAGGTGGGKSDETGIGGSDGGRGGDGGYITLTNSATVTLAGSLPDGGMGIFAESRAGQGGDQDSTLGDQRGGNSGDAKDIALTNAGTVQLGTSSAYLSGKGFAWGIVAEGRGNEGGEDNGKGGTGGNIFITNTGSVSVYWNGQDGTANGVRGIYGLSSGGDGRTSNDDSDTGGDGEAGYEVQVSSSGNVTVYASSNVEGLSAGILAVSEGGDGGGAPGQNKGGDGANASDTTGGIAAFTRVDLSGSGQVATHGNNISGVIARGKGGDGGDGEDGAHDSSGGDGGNGGAIAITLSNQASISTNGTQSYGILAQSIGGAGGDGGDDTALVGTTGGGGYGGNGGGVTVTAASGNSIITRANTSSAIVAQSIGGGGGDGGDFIAILAGSGGKGGRGGDGGTVTVTNAALLETSGYNAHGILAQSIAGAGGTGDVPASVILALGGDGGDGGDAGHVDVRNSGIILTYGLAAKGIIAQSVSGAGGVAGTDGGGKLTIGGSGGGGGSGGLVTLAHTGVIQTEGAASTGILAQSIGGGGGVGANAFGIMSVGGSGGAGGDAGKVFVGASGAITTDGFYANGITAQSIGGGGGDGGFALDFSVVIPAVGIGGSGGVSGNGNDVDVGNVDPLTGASLGALSIATYGNHSYGILAQSIGGGGGSGGSAIGGGLFEFVALQIGGSSGEGSDGNDVRVKFSGLSITTHGTDSIGIVANSTGGGGGDGGAAFGGDVNVLLTVAAAVGGAGGKGGNADTVTVDLTDSTLITGLADDVTAINDATGIVASSIGGGGGLGGLGVQAALSQVLPVIAPATVTAAMSLGGSGGDGGDGDIVTVDLRGATSVTTYGQGSIGVIAQSVGGGGGYGKNGWTYAMTSGLGAGVFAADLSVAVGGSGGGGGDGAATTVTLHDSAEIMTNGKSAHGILAQSIGGGGGNAGAATAKASGSFGFSAITGKIGVGATGGDGGDGADATVTTEAGTLVSTTGPTSYGILVQSVGGGGGVSTGMTAGATEKAGAGETFTISASETLTIGLTGGAGGHAGTTTANIAGTVSTSGDGSYGVVAQSIGGGGGAGGSVVGNAIAGSNILSVLDIIWQNYNLNLSLGGSGGDGGNGGDTNVTFSGWITTTGNHSIGLIAQSIGGGGGIGGTSIITDAHTTAELSLLLGGTGGGGGRAGNVSIDFDGSNADSISTSGLQAHGAVAQSVGGGGGLGGDGSSSASGRLVIGASGGGTSGDGNSGGDVTTQGWLTVTTHGLDAIGLVAQSVGGGGGIAGQGSSSNVDNQLGVSLDLVVGGSGGAGGDGGDVTVSSGVSAMTYGARAHGILAQSVGGGGGLGIVGDRGNILSLSLGGSGGVSGDGGAVIVAPTAGSFIQTNGAGAIGILAQSIGGGGGLAGDASGGPLTYGADKGGAGIGNGGIVTVAFNGTLQTSGAYAHGIFAQSVGGGGGLGGDSAGTYAGSTGVGNIGTADDVTVAQYGTLLAVGNGSHGIFAQSQGPDGNGTIDVEVWGTVIGGNGTGTGVTVAGGVNNSLTIQSGAVVSANSGTAIVYAGDRLSSQGSALDVYNYGTITGDVILDNADHGYAGTLYNYSYNTLNSNLVQADVVNSGRVVVGLGGLGQTLITGNFTQTAAGILQVDADYASGAMDLLVVEGNAALAGLVRVVPSSLLPGTLRFLEVGGTATGTLQGERLNMFDFAVSSVGGNGYALTPSANFTRGDLGLDGQQTAVAVHLQDIWNAGGGAFGPLFAALATGTGQAYQQGLGGLGSGVTNAPAAENIALTQQRLDRTMGCQGFQAAGAAAQADCAWAQAGGQYFDQGSIGGAQGYSDTVYTYALGGQKQIAPGWTLGAAASYEASDISASGNQLSFDGQIFSAGVSLRHDLGNWQIGAAVTGSIGTFDSTRFASIGSVGGIAEGSQDLYGFGGRLRAAYVQPFGPAYLKPYVDFDLVYTDAGGYTESGAGLLDRQVAGSSQWAALATPSLEFGAKFDLERAYVMRTYARIGLTVSSADDWTSTVGLAAAPAGIAGFASTLPVDDVYGRFGAGIDMLSLNKAMSLRAEYDGSFSSNTTRQMGSLRLSVGF